uniref:Uncharacterized protein n=1 Tax=Anopheles albimanus TaxID=7167 RepID=A0A182FMP5_ANOAL
MTLVGGRRKGRWRWAPHLCLPALATLMIALSYLGITVALEELRCERIAIGACQNLEYNMTIVLANHQNSLLFGGELHITATAPHQNQNGTARVRWVDAERLSQITNMGDPFCC